MKALTGFSRRAGDGGKKARLTRESAKETVKTIRAGNAGSFRCDRGDYACVHLLTAHKAAGATGARHSLRPLNSGALTCKTRAPLASWERGGVRNERHCEERSDEAIQTLMVGSGLLRFARNDDRAVWQSNPNDQTPATAPPARRYPCLQCRCGRRIPSA